MKNSFYEASKIEKQVDAVFIPMFDKFLNKEKWSLFHHDSKELQKLGDYTIVDNNEKSVPFCTIDRKAEAIKRTTMYFEIWSNYQHKLGWGLTGPYDFLSWSWINDDYYPFFDIQKIRDILNIKYNDESSLIGNNFNGFSIKGQYKFNQRNSPVGISIPFSYLESACSFVLKNENGVLIDTTYKDFMMSFK
ncbi:hypothetical protein [Gluconacetobacter diazotrophicus]|uniref:hypothetical protein n=1 Tax=Gluconacetobacter diazotrophicus TaxID=33996 RepID=UPI0011A73073|nr:hypothetical protein [Gluconacetobacter diazotrophicus]